MKDSGPDLKKNGDFFFFKLQKIHKISLILNILRSKALDSHFNGDKQPFYHTSVFFWSLYNEPPS